jgi:hypothetical protein
MFFQAHGTFKTHMSCEGLAMKFCSLALQHIGASKGSGETDLSVSETGLSTTQDNSAAAGRQAQGGGVRGCGAAAGSCRVRGAGARFRHALQAAGDACAESSLLCTRNIVTRLTTIRRVLGPRAHAPARSAVILLAKLLQVIGCLMGQVGTGTHAILYPAC